jgi:hypothetical protein
LNVGAGIVEGCATAFTSFVGRGLVSAQSDCPAVKASSIANGVLPPNITAIDADPR